MTHNKHRVKQAEAFVGRRQVADQVNLSHHFAAIKASLNGAQDAEVVALFAKDETAGLTRLLEFGQEANPQAYQVIVAELQRREAATLAG